MNDKEFGTPAHMLTRTDDPHTSHEAGESVDTTKREKEIFDLIASFDQERGCTAWEIEEKSGIHAWSISPRFKALERKGFIYYQGDTRKGRTNRQQRVIRTCRRKRVMDMPYLKRRHDDKGQAPLL